MGELVPLADGLSSEVHALCEALRGLFGSLDVSMRRYAARRSRDAGAVSRYMSGGRIPPWDFVLDLLNDVAEIQGNSPTPEAVAFLKDLHRKALKVSNAPAHAALVLQDQLAEADRAARGAMVERQVLTEALQERQRRVAELQVEISQAEASKNRQVSELTAEVERYQARFADLMSEGERLRSIILTLENQLEEASRRHLEAERRCELLERQLAAIDQKLSDGKWGTRTKTQILVVDSRQDNVLALQATLEAMDQELHVANSCDQALTSLDALDAVSLILLSAEMDGETDGFTIAAQIKRRLRTRHIPIIFLTSEMHGPHYTFRGYAAGAVDYISRPIDPWVLRAKVAVFVELYWRRDEAMETSL
ncbi:MULTISPECIES: two-component system response regulator [Streptomyces violaceoruber group]|uniref:Response regulator n=1 Tax=Streptomyces rubrogriseus TaxID=194673 RepID=A0ABT4NWC6_9ACTN|nr:MULTISPECIES: response regulator [Streptomyces anthocyanicus group]MCW8116818.1 response regulator [Streptomyces anthocyanicus]MCZ4633413.1 response regulator [Streptomyces rubrogriseus]